MPSCVMVSNVAFCDGGRLLQLFGGFIAKKDHYLALILRTKKWRKIFGLQSEYISGMIIVFLLQSKLL